MHKIYQISLISLTLILSSGCASRLPQSTDVEKSIYQVKSPYSYNEKFKENINVETYDFMETSKNGFSSKSSANLNNETAKDAISRTIESADLLAKLNDGDYILIATLIDPDLSGVLSWKNNVYKRNIGIHYTLKNNKTNDVLYDKTVQSPVKRPIKFITFDGWKEKKITSEMSYNKNFMLLMEDLKAL